MKMIKRFFFFFLTNILILITLSIVLNFLGVGHYLTAQGIDYTALMLFCLVWGMGGAFISLAISRIMAKWMMGVKLINPQTTNAQDRQLLDKVYNLCRKAGLSKMPQVGFYESPEINAFATGPTKSRALVAVSSGLLNTMNDQELEGVLGHEVAHIANGDMVTMTLIQGVVNAFVMFIARVIAFAVSQAVESRNRRMVHFITVIVLEILLSILGMMVVAYFSRHREFRADNGGAKLAGRESMIAGLRRLQRFVEGNDDSHQALNTLKISTKKRFALLSTHPPLEERIRRLEMANLI